MEWKVFSQNIRRQEFNHWEKKHRILSLSLFLSLIPAYKGKVHHQRKHKYVNPAYMTTIVAGSAGGEEKLSHSTAPKQMVAKYLKNYG